MEQTEHKKGQKEIVYVVKESKTNEEIIKDFEERRDKNLSEILDRSYSLMNYGTKLDGKEKTCMVSYNKEGEINGSPCSYCYAHTPLNPFRSGAYVFTACEDCMQNCKIIEEFRSGVTSNKNESRKARMAKIDPRSLKIDWNLFETQVKNKQAQMGLFAKHYGITPQEAKTILLEKYGAKLQIRRGRGGGLAIT